MEGRHRKQMSTNKLFSKFKFFSLMIFYLALSDKQTQTDTRQHPLLTLVMLWCVAGHLQICQTSYLDRNSSSHLLIKTCHDLTDQYYSAHLLH